MLLSNSVETVYHQAEKKSIQKSSPGTDIFVSCHEIGLFKTL